MCFEFEAMYWARLAEEEVERKETEKQLKAAPGGAANTTAKPQHQAAYDEDPLPL